MRPCYVNMREYLRVMGILLCVMLIALYSNNSSTASEAACLFVATVFSIINAKSMYVVPTYTEYADTMIAFNVPTIALIAVMRYVNAAMH